MKIFHGWKMVGAAAGIQMLHAALLHQAFGAYFAVLIEEKGWSKTSLSAASAMQSMESAIIGPLLGWAIDRFGPQTMIRVGILTFGLGLMLFSQIDTLAGLYGAVLVIALGASLSGYFPLNIAIIHWFERKRARALSMSGLGLALGGILVPAVAWSIHHIGWRPTVFCSGLLMIAIGWPLATTFKRRPQDIGETVDGLPPAQPGVALQAGDDSSSQREFTAREALRTSAFWLLALGHGFALLVVTAVNVHAITHMRESLGYSVAQASLYIMMMTFSQLAGVLIGGVLGDRYSKRWICAACMLMHASGLLMLTYATGALMLTAFALLHGLAWGLRGPFMQAIRADYFGRRSIGIILGLSSLIISIGQIGGPLVAGMFADATGNYRTGFTVLAVIAGLGSMLFIFARKPA
ncbi:MAG: MFS transporter [Betaproteobacteria bacterium]|nr:MFS transporter [Betaproteobacteria bacterium]